MKKQLLKSALIAVAGVGLLVGSASAYYINFGNADVTFTDTDTIAATTGDDTIKFQTSTISSIKNDDFSPVIDAYLQSLRINLIDMYFSGTSGSYQFMPTSYNNAFSFTNTSNQIVLTADVDFTSLQTVLFNNSTIGSATSNVTLNLTDINFVNYSGGSAVLDSLALYDGSVTITFQLTGSNLASLIDNNQDATVSYSGNIHTAIPEPATMLLFGTGVVGLASIARRKNK